MCQQEMLLAEPCVSEKAFLAEPGGNKKVFLGELRVIRTFGHW